MKRLNLFRTTISLVSIIFLFCLTIGCQQQVEEGITDEEAKVLVDKTSEIMSEGNLSLIDEIADPNHVGHFSDTDTSEYWVGIDGYKKWVTDQRTDFPDYNASVQEIIVKDDRIVTRWIVTGTNTGSSTELPPTNKKILLEAVTISRLVDGKIVETVIYYNTAAVLTQLGYTITPPTFEVEEE